MSFKYKALSNFSMSPYNMVTVELLDTIGMSRSDAQYIVKNNFPDSVSYGAILLTDKFIKSKIKEIYKFNLELVYLGYSRELDYFIYIVNKEGELVMSGFKLNPKDSKSKAILDIYPVSKLRTYIPRSIVLVDNTKEFRNKDKKKEETKV